jgi:hypothetical protein
MLSIWILSNPPNETTGILSDSQWQWRFNLNYHHSQCRYRDNHICLWQAQSPWNCHQTIFQRAKRETGRQQTSSNMPFSKSAALFNLFLPTLHDGIFIFLQKLHPSCLSTPLNDNNACCSTSPPNWSVWLDQVGVHCYFSKWTYLQLLANPMTSPLMVMDT